MIVLSGVELESLPLVALGLDLYDGALDVVEALQLVGDGLELGRVAGLVAGEFARLRG